MNDEKTFAAYSTMRRFLGFGDDDAARLKAFLPQVENRLPAITDRFYELLGQQEDLKALLEGRMERLKTTHTEWLRGLFSGDYGESYFREQLRVGFVHVKVNLDSVWVDAVMNALRRDLHAAILAETSSSEEAVAVYGSLLKVMDLALMTINMAYNQHRMQLLHEATGMQGALIERLIRLNVDR
ncbi:MAG: hypothetical protein GY856_33500 [bacterium]|nr:hypothetical protein [bacterium]